MQFACQSLRWFNFDEGWWTDLENIAAFPEQSANLFGLVHSHHSKGFILVALIRDSEDKNASDGREEKP